MQWRARIITPHAEPINGLNILLDGNKTALRLNKSVLGFEFCLSLSQNILGSKSSTPEF